jgi:phage tail-like protein
MEVNKNAYPTVGFNFRVTSSDAGFGLLGALKSITGFDSSQTDASFQSVNGISAKLEVKTYSPLGSNNKQIKLPGSVSYDDLELTRGIVKKNSDIGKWCDKFLTNDQFGYSINRKTINVFLLDNNSDEILMSWTFFDCYPIEISIEKFDAMEGKLAIETMKLTYSHFKKS